MLGFTVAKKVMGKLYKATFCRKKVWKTVKLANLMLDIVCTRFKSSQQCIKIDRNQQTILTSSSSRLPIANGAT